LVTTQLEKLWLSDRRYSHGWPIRVVGLVEVGLDLVEAEKSQACQDIVRGRPVAIRVAVATQEDLLRRCLVLLVIKDMGEASIDGWRTRADISSSHNSGR
jgi:hypothetical protein